MQLSCVVFVLSASPYPVLHYIQYNYTNHQILHYTEFELMFLLLQVCSLCSVLFSSKGQKASYLCFLYNTEF